MAAATAVAEAAAGGQRGRGLVAAAATRVGVRTTEPNMAAPSF